jgi:hypothetical protein
MNNISLLAFILSALFMGCNPNDGISSLDLTAFTATTNNPSFYDNFITWRESAGTAPSICWMGDSRIQYFLNEFYFPNRQWNIGGKGSSTNGLLVRIPYVKLWKPDVTVISMGINDYFFHYSITVENIRTAIKELKPYTGRIIVTSIVPAVFNIEDLQETNLAIKQVCIEEGMVFVNLTDMEIDGLLNPAYADEGGVHYNSFGYAVFVDAIRGVL